MLLAAKEDAFIQKADGTRVGPYKAKFAGDTVIINDQMADIDDGDFVIRTLPSKKEEKKQILKSTFYDSKIGGFGPHFQLKVGRVIEKSPLSQQINIHGGNVQIGNHNRQEITNSIETLNNLINSSQGTNEQKAEAKSLLSKLAEHPLITAIAGGAIALL